MATYYQLLLSTGGGVISQAAKSNRAPGNHVFIGLGGTGVDAIQQIKNDVYKKIKPSNGNADIPVYDGIGFLAIDSDPSKFAEDVQGNYAALNRQTEFKEISCRNFAGAVAGIHPEDPVFKWYNRNINLSDIRTDHGAGGFRQVGRLLLIQQAQSIYNEIRSIIDNTTRGSADRLYIHIFAGISGGTGSGTFLDICYLVKEQLKALGKDGNADIFGYFFLPDVNIEAIDQSGTQNSQYIIQYVQRNGYASLKELDYLMNMENNHDSFEQDYGNGIRVNTSEPPVDMCYLISATNSAGTTLRNGYDYAMHVVSDFCLEYLSRLQLPEGVTMGTADQGLSLEGHKANLELASSGISRKHGAFYKYYTIGGAVVELPRTEIATYLGSGLLAGIAPLKEQRPTADDVKYFEQNIRMDRYESLLGFLRRDIDSRRYHMPDFDFNIIKETLCKAKEDEHFAPWVKKSEEYRAYCLGMLEENYLALTKGMPEQTKDWAQISDPQTPRETLDNLSFIQKIYRELHSNYLSEYDKGVFYVEKLMRSGSDNLIHTIERFKKENDARRKAALFHKTDRENQMKDAKAKIISAGLFSNKNKLKENYKSAVAGWYNNQLIVDECRYIDLMLDVLARQIHDLADSFVKKLGTVLENLKETFDENRRFLLDPNYHSANYIHQITSVRDSHDQLDQLIRVLNMGDEMKRFVSHLLEKKEIWMNEDETKLTRLVSDYINDKFDSFLNQSMGVILRGQMGNLADVQLVDEIVSQVFTPNLGVDISAPLFWTNGAVFNRGNETVPWCILTAPFADTVVMNAAEQYAGTEGFTCRPADIGYQVSCLRFYAGIPLYAYQALGIYKNIYDTMRNPGLHLYENGEKDWRILLPDLTPSSIRNANFTQAERDQQGKDRTLFDKAKADGILHSDPVNNCWVLDQKFQVDVIPLKDKDVMKLTVAACTDEIQKLQAASSGTLIRSFKIPMPNVVEAFAVDDVVFDNYSKIPVVKSIAHREMRNLEVIQDNITMLRNRIAQIGNEKKERDDFFDALLTGAIAMEGTMLKIPGEGLDKEIILSDAKMEYGKFYGAYQAYLTYQGIAPARKTALRSKSDNSLSVGDSSLKEAVKKVADAHTQVKLQAISTALDGDPKAPVILQFYNDLMEYMQVFCTLNNIS